MSQSDDKTRQEAYDFLVKVGAIRPGVRKLEGLEAEHVMTMLLLMEPVVTTNNQRSWTDDYIVGDLHYSVNYFSADDYFIEETKINDIQSHKKT